MGADKEDKKKEKSEKSSAHKLSVGVLLGFIILVLAIFLIVILLIKNRTPDQELREKASGLFAGTPSPSAAETTAAPTVSLAASTVSANASAEVSGSGARGSSMTWIRTRAFILKVAEAKVAGNAAARDYYYGRFQNTASSASGAEASGESASSAATASESQTSEGEKPEGEKSFWQELQKRIWVIAAGKRSSMGTVGNNLSAVDPARKEWNYSSDGQKTVYLTFDDGPSYLTQRVLDILDSYHVKGTFFVTGLNPEYAGMIGEAVRRGHTVGMLTYSNSYEVCYPSEENYLADLSRIAQTIQSQIGYIPCYIRFPGGSSNGGSAAYCQGIMTTLSSRVQELGYQYWDWDYVIGDSASTTDDAAQVLASENEDIFVLLYDGNGREDIVEVLPGLIEGLKGKGYAFSGISRDTMVLHHGIQN